MPLSGSSSNTSELLENQTEWLMYQVMCGYVTCVQVCRGTVRCVSRPNLAQSAES
jgi:hypothetical protein